MLMYLRLGAVVFLILWGAWERNGKLQARMELATSANERANAVIEAQAKAHADHLAAITERVERGSNATLQAASTAATIQRQTGALVGALRGIENEADSCLDADPGPAVRGLLAPSDTGALPGGGGAGGVPARAGGPDATVPSGGG